jgi:hypothetical protein
MLEFYFTISTFHSASHKELILYIVVKLITINTIVGTFRIAVILDVAPCDLRDGYHPCRGTRCLFLHRHTELRENVVCHAIQAGPTSS